MDGPEWSWQAKYCGVVCDLSILKRLGSRRLHLICSDKNDRCKICFPDLPTCVQYWSAAVWSSGEVAIDQKSELPDLPFEATGAMDQFKVIADQYVQ